MCMRSRLAIVTAIVSGLGPGLLHAQATDTAAERARLGNERARIEAEQRAREAEANAVVPEADTGMDAPPPPSSPDSTKAMPPGDEPAPPEPTTPAAPAAPAATAEPVPPIADSSAAAPGHGTSARDKAAPTPDPDEISRALEQLRELGKLRDAGYVTDEEFDRIKQRILDGRF